MEARDGMPLPGRTAAEVVSQLAYRVLGPYNHRARSVRDWAGLLEHSPSLQREVAERYGVSQRTIGQRIQRVAAAGRKLPLDLVVTDDLARPARTGENLEVRRRCGFLLGQQANMSAEVASNNSSGETPANVVDC